MKISAFLLVVIFALSVAGCSKPISVDHEIQNKNAKEALKNL